MKYTLDASAVLALTLKEEGWEKVFAALTLADSLITTVNLAEVLTRYVRAGASAGQIQTVRSLVRRVLVPVDEALAAEAAQLWSATKPAGLSLGDRMCLALAKREGLPALTADKSWLTIADAAGVTVELIR